MSVNNIRRTYAKPSSRTTPLQRIEEDDYISELCSIETTTNGILTSPCQGTSKLNARNKSTHHCPSLRTVHTSHGPKCITKQHRTLFLRILASQSMIRDRNSSRRLWVAFYDMSAPPTSQG